MGKGMTPKKGYNDKKYKEAYDKIDWSTHKKGTNDYGRKKARSTSSIYEKKSS